MINEKWAVVEEAGFANERIVLTCETYDDACAFYEQYMSSEIEELHVDIMKWDDETQSWTTEY